MDKRSIDDRIKHLDQWLEDRKLNSNYDNLRDFNQMIGALKDCFGDVGYALGHIKEILQDIKELKNEKNNIS